VLSQIVQLVVAAQRSRLRYSGWPIRCRSVCSGCRVIALVTFFAWACSGPPVVGLRHGQRDRRADHRLPVCPRLATPMSIMVATGRGDLGSLFKDAEAIEHLREVDTLSSTRPAR